MERGEKKHQEEGERENTPGTITFCIPMLAKNLKYLQITGYNGSTQVFQTSKKDIGTARDIERNKMYTLPAISID